MKKTYKITKNNFCGKEGDILEYDSNSFGGDGSWKNLTQNTMGSPFVEFDSVEEVRE